MPTNLDRLDEALRAVRGRPLASLAFAAEAEDARTRLALHGFRVLREQSFRFAIFSSHQRFDFVAFIVEAPPPIETADGPRAVPAARELVLRRPPSSPRAWREDRELIGSIDEPVAGVETSSPLFVRGWARIATQDLTVRVLLDGVERAPKVFRRTPRPDVAGALPALGPCATAGWEAVVPLTAADAGERRLGAVFRTRDGRQRHYPEIRIVVRAPSGPALSSKK
jgi:hypothetical protein